MTCRCSALDLLDGGAEAAARLGDRMAQGGGQQRLALPGPELAQQVRSHPLADAAAAGAARPGPGPAPARTGSA